MINNQVRQQQKMRNADLRLNSPQEGIAKQATLLHEKIMQMNSNKFNWHINSSRKA